MKWCEWSVAHAQLIDCDRGPPLYDLGCDGGNFEGGILYIAENGIDLEADYPYLAKDGKCRRATLWSEVAGRVLASFVSPSTAA